RRLLDLRPELVLRRVLPQVIRPAVDVGGERVVPRSPPYAAFGAPGESCRPPSADQKSDQKEWCGADARHRRTACHAPTRNRCGAGEDEAEIFTVKFSGCRALSCHSERSEESLSMPKYGSIRLEASKGALVTSTRASSAARCSSG